MFTMIDRGGGAVPLKVVRDSEIPHQAGENMLACELLQELGMNFANRLQYKLKIKKRSSRKR